MSYNSEITWEFSEPKRLVGKTPTGWKSSQGQYVIKGNDTEKYKVKLDWRSFRKDPVVILECNDIGKAIAFANLHFTYRK